MLKVRDAKEIFAWCVDDPSGQHGVPAIARGDGFMLPLVTSSFDAAAAMKLIAQRVAEETGLPVRLHHFTKMEVIDTVLPPPVGLA